jgi:hypothetical protein
VGNSGNSGQEETIPDGSLLHGIHARSFNREQFSWCGLNMPGEPDVVARNIRAIPGLITSEVWVIGLFPDDLFALECLTLSRPHLIGVNGCKRRGLFPANLVLEKQLIHSFDGQQIMIACGPVSKVFVDNVLKRDDIFGKNVCELTKRRENDGDHEQIDAERELESVHDDSPRIDEN